MKKQLQFIGPFNWRESKRSKVGRTVPKFGDYADCSGVYLWTVPTNACERIFNVGKTKRFKDGHQSHISNYGQGYYGIYDSSMLCIGELQTVFAGEWNVGKEGKPAIRERFRREQASLLRLAAKNLDILNVWIACIDDVNLANWVKSGIYDEIKCQNDPNVQKFLPPMDPHTFERRTIQSTELQIKPASLFDGLPDVIEV